jgi:hypothetical protein
LTVNGSCKLLGSNYPPSLEPSEGKGIVPGSFIVSIPVLLAVVVDKSVTWVNVIVKVVSCCPEGTL